MADVSSPFVEKFLSGPQFSRTEVYYSPPGTPTDDCTKNPLDFGAVSPKSAATNGSVAEEVARAMGIPDTIVKLVKDFHSLRHGTELDAGELYAAAEDLLSNPEKQAGIYMKLYEAEQAKKEEEAKSKDLFSKAAQDAGVTREVSASHSAEMQKEALAESKPSEEDKAQLKEKVRNLAKENQRLRRRKVCCECKEVDLTSSGVTFLPCGHFITCETCSEKFEDCPACGKSIMGTVRTFLS